jgi:methionyl-tRNA formyltransferase
MTKTSETVVFFGSGPVAAESLRLLAQEFRVEAVITKPRPAHHRGNVPVIDLATKLATNTYSKQQTRIG